MKISMLSGKGGTGKTTFSVNLFQTFPGKISLIDADVEEPNSYLFFQTDHFDKTDAFVEFPCIDQQTCTLCGACGEFCRFNAILPARQEVLVFKESCHSCKGCAIVCPNNSISYSLREIGRIYKGNTEPQKKLLYGILNIGELSGVKIIKKLLDMADKDSIALIDSPPGASCSAAAAVETSDYAVIIAEPTPFGINDMDFVVRMLRQMDIPFGCIINKFGLGNNDIIDYCKSNDIRILGKLDFDRSIAETYADGKILSEIQDKHRIFFEKIWQTILDQNNRKNPEK